MSCEVRVDEHEGSSEKYEANSHSSLKNERDSFTKLIFFQEVSKIKSVLSENEMVVF
jgi:hypothetical protein